MILNLETAFGDPYDVGNPYGHDAIIEADERAEIFEGGEQLIDTLGAAAEFVPRHLGGRLDTIDAFIRRLRPLFRRDAGLGLGHGTSTMLAALNVWLAGDEAQQRSLASTILTGTKVSLAHGMPETRHYPTSADVTACVRGDTFVLDGRTGLIFNGNRSGCAVVLARTADVPRERSHSLLLVDLTSLPASHWQRLPRFRTMGLRDCQLGGLEFNCCPVPGTGLVGTLGGGNQLARRAAQIGGCLTMGLALGMLDASLFTVLRFAVRRRLYARTVADLPHARASLAGTFADLLALDCLITTAARAAHAVPGISAVYAAAAKHLAPNLLEYAMNELSVVLGARYYLREGEHAIFGKHFRDLPALGVTYPDRMPDEFTILRHLPALARALRGPRDSAPPPAIFETATPLPRLEPKARPAPDEPADPLLSSLAPWLDELRRETADAADVSVTADLLLAEREKLVIDAGALPTWRTNPAAGPDSGTQTERYAILLTAAACLGVWRHNRDRRVLTDTAWIRVALRRLLGWLVPGAPPSPMHLDDALFKELTARADEQVGFCLDEDPVLRTLPC